MLAVLTVIAVVLFSFIVGIGAALALSGVLADRFPVLHARLAEITRHLNGDAEAPERVKRFFDH